MTTSNNTTNYSPVTDWYGRVVEQAFSPEEALRAQEAMRQQWAQQAVARLRYEEDLIRQLYDKKLQESQFRPWIGGNEEVRPPVDVSKVEECECGAPLVVKQQMGIDVPKPYTLVHGGTVVAALRLSALNKLGGFAPRVLLPKLGGCPDAGNRKAYRGWFK